MIGKRLGHYEILDRLGAGGMGEVFQARDPRLQRLVAIKIIGSLLREDVAARARFQQEARAAATLDHPNICAIYQVDETPEGQVYLVMAHYEGMTLDRRLLEGPLPIPEAVAIALQVANGLARAHAMGIVHRDIKLSNVMVTTDGVVKILDFGLAKMVGGASLTTSDMSPGTPASMAPEQVHGAVVDARADQWALGVLIQAMVTGVSPFEKDSLPATLYAIMNADPDPLSKYVALEDEGLQRIVTRCLQRDPVARYERTESLVDDLRSVLERLAPGRASQIDVPGSTSGGQPRLVTRNGDPSLPVVPTILPSVAARRHALPIAAILGVGLLAGAWWFIQGRPREALRVAVLPVTVRAGLDSLQREDVASSVQLMVTRSLANLRDIAPVDPAELRGVSGGPREFARITSADQLIAPEITESGDEWKVQFRRLSGVDGHVLGAREFQVQRDDPQLFANALAVHLGYEYPGHRARAKVAIDARTEDYRELSALRRIYYGGAGAEASPDQLLERLLALERSSPRFLEAWLFDAEYSLNRFLITRNADMLRRAGEAVDRARGLAPEDPRIAHLAFRVSLEAGDLPEAGRRLAELRQLDPGNVTVLVDESSLSERRGDAEAALAAMSRALRRHPSRAHYQRLADLEYRNGKIESARAHLDTLIARFPGDRYPRSKLAQLELLYGNPARAEKLYGELIARNDATSTYWTNRGLARMLQKKYREAAEDFGASSRLATANPGVLLNLADTELLLGRHDSALQLYRRVLQMEQAPGNDNSVTRRLNRAQCRARLGDGRGAVSEVQDAMRIAGEDSEAHYTASLVYALVGERASALVNAQKALRLGVQPRWYDFPWFEGLRSDPEFKRTLESGARPA